MMNDVYLCFDHEIDIGVMESSFFISRVFFYIF